MAQPILFRLRSPVNRIGFSPLVTSAQRTAALRYTGALQDNFDDNARGPQWVVDQFKAGTGVTTAGVVVSETNQRLEVTPPTSGAGFPYSGYVSTETFDATNDGIFSTYALSGTADPNFEAYISFGLNSDNRYTINPYTTDIQLQKSIAGTQTNVGTFTRSATTHKWVRLRHQASDDTIKIDTAPDTAANPPLPGEWVNRLSVARDTAFSTSRVKVGVGVGIFGSVASPPTAIFDGVNVATTSAVAVEDLYKGAVGQAARYLGTRTEAQLYLGAQSLWP